VHSRTVLIGYSMTAALALRVAVRRPPDRLILVAPLWRLAGAAWPLGARLLLLVCHLVRDLAGRRHEAGTSAR
jgi:pimeloyl-ACP methyl ester carboxylesterase